MGHHGGWHREATRGVIVPDNKKHPILTGVGGIWGTSDVYRCHNDKNPFPEDCTSLVLGQPLINLKKDALPNTKKEPLPIAWTKTYQLPSHKNQLRKAGMLNRQPNLKEPHLDHRAKNLTLR